MQTENKFCPYGIIFDHFIKSAPRRVYWGNQSLFEARALFEEFRSLRLHGSRQSGKSTALIGLLAKHTEVNIKLFYPGEYEVEHFDIPDNFLIHKNLSVFLTTEELRGVEVLLIDQTTSDVDSKAVYDEVVELWIDHQARFHPNFSIIMIE